MKARGFGTVELVVAVVVAGLLAAAVVVVRGWVVDYGAARFTAGELQERGKWQARESEELVSANTMIRDLEERARAAERKNADDVQAVAVELEKAKKEVEDAKSRAVADRDAGRAFGLRWQGSPAATGETGIRGPAAAPGADPGDAGRTATCRLPRPLEDALIELAADADTVAGERNALLKIAQKDREVCR